MAGRKKPSPERLLSICIPTFNRAGKLDLLLGRLQGQARGVESEIEICISSNGSTDGTDAVVAKWGRVLPISYRKNERNRGFDFNMLSVVKMAKGRYCWCFSDDDRLGDGSVKTLLADIKSLGKREIGAISANVSHSPLFLNGRKYNNLPDGPFRVYAISESACPPLSVLHMSLLCLHRRTAHGIIGKKIYLDGNRVCKRGSDKHMLYACLHSYLFLECVKKSGFLGVEPKSLSHIVVAEGATISYGRKMCLEMISFNYTYDILGNYPEFKGDFAPVSMAGRFLVAAMVCENPALEDAYVATNLALVKLLEMEGRRNEIRLVRMLEMVRKLPLMPRIIPAAYRAFLTLRGKGNALRNRGDAGQAAAELLFMTSYTKEKFRS